MLTVNDKCTTIVPDHCRCTYDMLMGSWFQISPCWCHFLPWWHPFPANDVFSFFHRWRKYCRRGMTLPGHMPTLSNSLPGTGWTRNRPPEAYRVMRKAGCPFIDEPQHWHREDLGGTSHCHCKSSHDNFASDVCSYFQSPLRMKTTTNKSTGTANASNSR